jgi:hypothetical protein
MTELALAATTPPPLAFMHDAGSFEHLYRVAKAFSMSGMVPQHYQGKPEACMVALMLAEQLGESPMLIFQEMVPINGRPSTSARFAIARANRSGLLKGPITWASKGTGEALEVQALATLAETGEAITAVVSMKEAAADGWTKNPKYRSMPEQMLRWRSATRLINLYIPEVLFGLGVREEEQQPIERVSVREEAPAPSATIAELNAAIQAAPAPAPAAEPKQPHVEVTGGEISVSPEPEPEPVMVATTNGRRVPAQQESMADYLEPNDE